MLFLSFSAQATCVSADIIVLFIYIFLWVPYFAKAMSGNLFEVSPSLIRTAEIAEEIHPVLLRNPIVCLNCSLRHHI